MDNWFPFHLNKVVFVHFILSILSISEVWRENTLFASRYFTLGFLVLSNRESHAHVRDASYYWTKAWYSIST